MSKLYRIGIIKRDGLTASVQGYLSDDETEQDAIRMAHREASNDYTDGIIIALFIDHEFRYFWHEGVLP